MGLEKYQSNSEELTFYDENNKPIGVVDRNEGINRGLLLEGVQLWLVNPDTNQVLMQRRSKNKKNNPNKIDVSVSGHVGEKETALQAVLREANEEIGIDKQELCDIMRQFTDIKINLADFGRQGNYICHLYLAFSRKKLEDFHKQDEEVDELFFMNYEEIKNRVRNNNEEMLMPNSSESERVFDVLDELILNKSNNLEQIVR